MGLDLSVSGHVALLTIDRPDKRNAIDSATHEALCNALAAVEGDHAIRVLVLTGAGSAFCAGSDLTAASAEASAAPVMRPRLVEPFERASKPIVAAINGPAVGGGMEIALCCDLRIASTSARFGFPEVRLGSLPGSGGTQRLSHAVGSALAGYMLLTGQLITAEQAFKAGLVSELCEPAALMERAMSLAAEIAANAPLSLVAVKRALRSAVESHLREGFALERTLFNQLATTEDRAEGRLAFRERRTPNFKGK
jgi:enoyl-CoA hydratase/carnithine racemase